MNSRPLFGAGAAALAFLVLSTAAATAAAPFTVRTTAMTTLSPAKVAAVQALAKPGLVGGNGKTLTVRRNARLVIWTGPDNDMLSYRVDGLRNPTLIIPHGATFQVLFVNTDDDMFHDWRVGPMPASWPADAAALMKTSVGTPALLHKTATTYHAEKLTLTAPARPGKYAYFCTVRGHAPGGMWGTLIVR